MTRVLVRGRNIVVFCPVEQNRVIRKIPAATWSATIGAWVIRPSKVAWGVLASIDGAAFEGCAQSIYEGTKTKDEAKWPEEYRPKTVPYAHQLGGSAKIFGRRESAIFAEPGTGKTKMAIDAISAKYSAGEIDRVLVLSPKSVRAVWVREFATHCPVKHSIALCGLKAPPPNFGLEVLVVSSEGMSTKNSFTAAHEFARGGRCAMVVDEAHMFKTHNASRSKNAKTVADLCASVTIMTGTPIGNSLVDLYSQFSILNLDIIGYPSFYAFCERYCVFGGYENRKVVGYEHEDELMAQIAPYVFRAFKADCLDLPPKVYQRRTVSMAPAQKAAYTELAKKLRLDGLETTNSLDLMLRLHQIAGGFLPSVADSGTEYGAISDGKMSELLNIIGDCDGQSMVVWCAYRHEVEHVVAGLSGAFGRSAVVEIHGGVDEKGRAESISAIQSGKARFLVGIASSGGVGVTATAASVVVYYSNNFSYINRVQSEDRAHRIGQTRTVTVVDLVTEGTIDETILMALDEKTDLARWVSSHGIAIGNTGVNK